MAIGGFLKNSFIDYPGKISCVIFLSGCNFDCPYCHNPELAKGNPAVCISADNIYDFLETRQNVLDGVVISGGEPTLFKGLFTLCEKIKKMGYSIKLDTNGSRPRVLKRLIDKKLIDYIAMDIKTDPVNYAPFIQGNCRTEHILSSIHIIMQSNMPYEFRTTCIKPLVNEHVIERISRIVNGSMLYALQQFHFEGVDKPDYFREKGVIFPDDELACLKSIAEQWVEKCVIR
ncbi:MAG: anaerobic ribonucleoside-triphosphate reductase activating protein [Deltaproteobacteria bacterium]|nr:anaerobic ribonucleoside-triphosphate reductase activating protein [Deltaproteobacteria bacterium]